MSALFDTLSEELFQILKGSGKTLTLYGEDGNKTYEPKSARRIFASPDHIMVSIIEAGSDSEVKLYLSQSTDIKEISKLINTLRMVTTRYNVLFNVRKYARELTPKDFAYQANIQEASMWGSTRSSYQKFGSSKLIIRHCRPVSEGIMGSRARHILGIFVESANGERFKFPHCHLSAGRAFAQHVNQGGSPYDNIGITLSTLAQESLQLGSINRYINHSRNILSEEALGLRPLIKNRLNELRKSFQTMSGTRGYHKIKEHLPVIKANLKEDQVDRIGQLQSLLKIDTNHALAESLMPVALLQMGENMTEMNKMFLNVLTLEEAAADALVEALLDEYGHSNENWTRFGSNIAFNESLVFEDATSFLNLVEAPYQINEADAVLDYATNWTMHRHAASGQVDDAGRPAQMDKDQQKGIDDLADGLRAILAGNFEIPEFPEHLPGFADTNAKARFYLDLYVGQNALANPATLNYVGTIIDKMAEGKKLDGAEKTIATKLIQTLEDDLNSGEVDESQYSMAYADEAEDHMFSAGDHVATDMGPATIISVDGDIAAVEFMHGGTRQMHVQDMDKVPGLAEFGEEAELAEWFNSFDPKNILEVNFVLPPQPKAPPTNPNFKKELEVGDRVTHSAYLSGEVVAVNDKFAKVLFDKPHPRLPDNRTVTLAKGAVTKAGAYRKESKSFNKVSNRVFETAMRTALDEGMLELKHFDGILAGFKEYAKKVFADPEMYGVQVPVGTDDRAEQEMLFNNHMAHVLSGWLSDAINDISTETTFKKQVDEARPGSNPTMTHWIEDENTGAEYELEVEYTIDDGSFATGLDYPKFHSYGEIVEIQGILNKTTGEDVDFDSLSDKDRSSIEQACIQDSNDRAQDAAEYRADARRDARYDESGDKGQDLIDDTKVPGSDAEWADKMDKVHARKEYADKFGTGVNEDLSQMSDDEIRSEIENGWKSRGTGQYLEYADTLRAELKRRGVSEVAESHQAEIDNLLKNAFFRK